MRPILFVQYKDGSRNPTNYQANHHRANRSIIFSGFVDQGFRIVGLSVCVSFLYKQTHNTSRRTIVDSASVQTKKEHSSSRRIISRTIKPCPSLSRRIMRLHYKNFTKRLLFASEMSSSYRYMYHKIPRYHRIPVVFIFSIKFGRNV